MVAVSVVVVDNIRVHEILLDRTCHLGQEMGVESVSYPSVGAFHHKVAVYSALFIHSIHACLYEIIPPLFAYEVDFLHHPSRVVLYLAFHS